MVCLLCSWIMPAMASEPPDGTSRVVLARRVLTPGTPLTVSVGSISETSVFTFRLMRPSDNTTGVKARATPNCLNEGGGGAAPGNTGGGGIGNSPPARKEADSPEIAVRVGSANVWTTPACSIARIVAVTDLNVPAKELVGGELVEKELTLLKLNTTGPA